MLKASQTTIESKLAQVAVEKNTIALEPSRATRLDQSASPTKGILLTPGTAATRRKTVSFSARKDFETDQKPSANALLDSNDPAKVKPEPGQTCEPRRRQSALTKTLIELSTKRSSPPVGPAQPATALESDTFKKPTANGNFQKSRDPFELIADQTIDLSQPRSRSGQHWKAEFEEYHKRSNREMKKIIQYGQNVKSFAVKKDFEVTNLSEKLQKELAKVARMESKVSKLAKLLKAAHEQGPEGESEQTRLVGELAQQTAMAVRYQRKAEQYRRAIGRRSASAADEQNQLLEEDDTQVKDHFEVATLQAQLESLQETATTAEKRASKLESENEQLKRSLARVKEEMMSYDTRRQAREERLKKREERHKSEKEQCEAQLAELRIEHQKLLQAYQRPGATMPHPVSIARDSPLQPPPLQDAKENIAPPPNDNQTSTRQPSLSPQKRRLQQKTAVDIWTLSSPKDNADQPSPKEGIELAPSSVKHDIHRALQEININLEQQSQSPAATEAKATTYVINAHPITQTSPTKDAANALTPTPPIPQHHTFPRSTASSARAAMADRSASSPPRW